MLALLQAQANLAREPYWYEILGGILAIPFLIVSIAYSYVLIKKTRIEQEKLRLESKKFALEIQEKENSVETQEKKTGVGAIESQTAQVIETIVEPIAESRNVQYIILRFILLFLALRGWALVDILTQGLADMLGSLAGLFSSGYIAYPILAIGGVVSFLPTLGAVVTTLIIGIPLFRDVNKIVGSKRLDDWFEKQIREYNRRKQESEDKTKSKTS